MQSASIGSSGLRIGQGQPLLLILGLNVLEDLSLAQETTQELKRVTRALNTSFIFKASFDKADRSSIHSYRGPGFREGLKILEQLKEREQVSLLTDVHETSECEPVAALVDLVQIPAFVCRQTDLVVAAAKAAEKFSRALHLKKGQFLAPADCRNILAKVHEAAPSRPLTIFCERGTTFGYNNLIADMLAIPALRALDTPVTFDATHAVQLPGAGVGNAGPGTASGGRRDGVATLAGAAVAAGAQGIFLEFHPAPDKAKCDGPSCLPLADAEKVLRRLLAIHKASA